MQNIKVKRYSNDMPSWEGTIEPEDESWILFIAKEGPPSLWLRVEVAGELCDDNIEALEAGAKTIFGYVPAHELMSGEGQSPESSGAAPAST